MKILKTPVDKQTALLPHGHCSCVELSEYAGSPLRYTGLRFDGDVNPHGDGEGDMSESYNSGVRDFLKFVPGSNKTIYLTNTDNDESSAGKWSYKMIAGCPA